MRTALGFRPLLVAGALVATASIAWACETKATACKAASSAIPACCVKAAAPCTATTPAETAAVPAAGEAGMRAYLDPETGTLGAPPSPPIEIEGVQSAAPVLREEILPDGSVMMDLQGTGEQFMILQLDANGERITRCVEDATKALDRAPAAKPEVK